ncbi:peptidoglycan-binding protein [Streptomyces sp. NPDC059781]|uniref:peptidoglycan-binding domain-containing protein n=1 Tax=Streptomyces sp. NPDC059781 TaxID=3346943 RepID=UPI0036699641
MEWEVDGLILYRLCLVGTRRRQGEKCTALQRAAGLAAVVRVRLSEEDTRTVLEGLIPSAQSPLQQAVGRASGAGTPSPNIRDDVMYAQLLLNDWRGRHEGQLIDEDGLYGPQTDGAIIDFQQNVTGIVDGRMDVQGPAVTALQQDHLRAAFAPGMLSDSEIPRLTLHGDVIHTDWDGEGSIEGMADEITWPMLLEAMHREVRGYFRMLYGSDDIAVPGGQGDVPVGVPQTLQALDAMGVDFSVPEATLQDWLGNPEFTPYPSISQALLRLGRRLRLPVFLDVVVWNYEHTPGAASPRRVEDVNAETLKAAVVKAFETRHGIQAGTFENVLGPQ